jgi:RNA polymerase sigma-70 factor (ECF subfamily)
MSSMPDSEKNFIRLLKQRDERAFEHFIRKYQNMVFSLALRFLGNYQDAEDITQEIFITVFKQIESFRGDSAMSTWLYRITVNHCKNRVKYLARRRVYRERDTSDRVQLQNRSSGFMGAQPDEPDRVLEAKEAETRIMQVLTEIDEDHKTILLLRELENLSYAEIAEIMQLEEGTVKSKLHRARGAFYAKFKEAKGVKKSGL